MAAREHVAGPGDDRVVTTLLQTVREVVSDARPSATPPTVRLDSRLDTDLGLDSLAVAELLARIEDDFGVALPDQVLARAETPADLLDEVVAASGTATGRRAARATPPEATQANRVVTSSDDVAVSDDVTPSDIVAPAAADSLVEVLRWHASEHPDRTHIRLVGDHGDDEELSYGSLMRRAAAVAAGLRDRNVQAGASVAIMLPTSRDYFVAFCGVLLAGCVPVPVYPPGRPSGLEEHLRRHVGILDNAAAVALVTVPEARTLARLVAPQIASLRHVVTVPEVAGTGGRAPGVRPDPSGTALLQYTSGSTGNPKGVVLSHANLLANIRAMTQAGGVTADDVFVSWLPLYHDMGLIGSWLLSLYAGIPFVVMSPLAFLARPVRWLRAITDHGGTLSGGPNFGYELCLRRVEDDDLDGLDLSRWRIAFNGAEPVSPDTVTRFTRQFAACGLPPGAMTPVYGLAESAVALTVPPPGRGPVIDRVVRESLARSGEAVPAAPDDPNAVRIVACGQPLPGHEVRVVDRTGTVVGDRREGRVEFRGPSATAGYHRNPDATSRLRRGDWLVSGDLGYLVEGELHLTGREKDIIIRAGRNLHPGELEEAVGAVDGVRKGCVAVFPTTDASTGTERLVVLAETRATDPGEREGVLRAVNEAVTDIAGTPPDDVVLAPPGTVPKTSSGKIRRGAARERYESGRRDGATRPVWQQLARVAAAGVAARTRRAAPGTLRTIYGAYAKVLFVATAVIVWPLVNLLPGLHGRWRVVRAAGRALLWLTGVRLSVSGRDHLPARGPYVVAANHASFLDPLVLTLVVPEPMVFAATGGLADNPAVRVFLRRMGAHLVERGDRARGVADVRELTDIARSGRVVAFFPEGRRTPAPGLEPFHMGAFRVGADAGVPVVPVTVVGTRHILPVDRGLPRRGPITVTIQDPVSTVEPGWAGAVVLHRHTRAAIARHLGEPDLA